MYMIRVNWLYHVLITNILSITKLSKTILYLYLVTERVYFCNIRAQPFLEFSWIMLDWNYNTLTLLINVVESWGSREMKWD